MNNHELLFRRIVDRNYIKTFYIFKRVIEVGGIRKLNKITKIPIASISRYLKIIENDLSLKIFEDNNNNFTPEAKKLYNIIEPLFTTISIIDRSIKSLSNQSNISEKENLTIKIATHRYSFSEVFPYIIKKYINEYTFEIDIIDRDMAFDMLKKLELDLILYPIDSETFEKYYNSMPDFKYIKLNEYKLYIHTSKNHNLLKISPLLLDDEDIYNSNYVPNKNYQKKLFPFGTRFVKKFENLKKKPHFITEVNDPSLLKNFIKNGLCVAITSKINVEDLEKIPLNDRFSNKVSWYIIYRNNNENIKDMISEFEKEISDLLISNNT